MRKIFLFFSFILIAGNYQCFGISFNPIARFESEYPQNLCVSDFNRDGKLDIAVACVNKIEIYSGNAGQSPYFSKVADIPLDGQLSFIISDDFNRDGKPDIAVTSYSYPEAFYVLLGNGDFSFNQSFSASISYPRGIVSSDFNRDGIPDIAVVSYNSAFFCYLGNGDGTFTLGSTNTTSYVSQYLTCADFDNDGIMDVAVTGYSNGYIHIFRGKGNGTFYQPENINCSSAWYITKGDFNRDGKIDLVVTSRGSGIYVYIGNGDCTFKMPIGYNVGSEIWGIEVADFDGDSIEDIAVVDSSSSTLKILKGKGDGSFQSDFNYTFSTGALTLISGDFTKNGKKDIAVISGRLVIFENSTEFKECGVLSAPTQYPTPENPRNVITADFNNDGILDLAVANYSGSVSIFIGKNDGTFSLPVNYNFESAYGYGFSPSDLVSGDFNRDGKIDIAVSNYNGYTYGVMINNGDGTFTVNIYHSLHNFGGFYSINSGDFNRDGKLDILITDNGYPFGGIIVLYGNGDGTFSNEQFYSISYAWRSAIGDFNKDGISDMAITRMYDGTIYLYIGNPENFSFWGDIGTGYGVVKPIFADFNSDGNLDIAVCDWASNQDVSFWLGNGQGTLFTLASRYAFGDSSNPYDIASADFNRDGVIDVVVARVSSLNIALLTGNNDGSFTLSGEFSAVAGYPRGICTGDFDRNGTIDIAVVRGESDGLSIFYNLLLEKGDINSDSVVDISDVILCLRQAIGLDPINKKLADMNGDGEVDISDVILILRKAIGLD